MKKLILVILAFAVFLAAARFAARHAVGAAEENVKHISVAGRDVALWAPIGAPPARGYPLVLFSHGFTGCNTQSIFLMEAFAKAGYFVLAPNHKDAHCGSARHSGSFGRPEKPLGDPQKWSDATYRDRRDDIEAVLDAALAEKSFQGVTVDPGRVGISGHSLGGYTALGLAGAWPSWRDPRIKAVLALSPYSNPYVANGDLAHLNVPVMYQGGTLDLGITPEVRRLNGAYDLTSRPKYYVEFDGAGHLAWTGLNRTYHESIDAYSVAFFDRYLKARTDPDPLAPLFSQGTHSGVSYLKSSKE
ncbi:MAG: dienelactone hydrolase family protein [Candidatus Acidiferrum sp.]